MPPEALVTALQPWADVYAESLWLPLALLSAHLLSLVAAAGVALAVDRRVLRVGAPRASVTSPPPSALLDELADAHPLVLRALTVTLLSGAAMATADLGTYASSTVFWSKMGLVVLLLANGHRMRRAERQLGAVSPAAATPAEAEPALGSLRAAAWRSVLLWSGIIVLGVVVSNQ